MSFAIGLACLAVAAFFVLNARAHKAAALEAQARYMRETGAQEPRKMHPSLEIMADVGPALVAVFLFFTGLMSAAAFLILPKSPWFSAIDLGGFLALLASYGHWITTRSLHRHAE